MGRLFGTDGVRGIANKDLTNELAMKIGMAAAEILMKNKDEDNKPKVMIGKDTRASGDMLEAALTSGFCAVGVDVISVGIVPTPAIAYLVGKYNCDAGVMISASHNPCEYNGIKIFQGNGYKLPDETEEEIEAIVLDNAEETELKLDLGLAFDGDADRMLAVDENGYLIDGDMIIAICSMQMKQEGKLNKDTAVVTVMSNMGFFKFCEENGIHCAKTAVGDRYVLERMLKKGYNIGGEQSGHVIFLDYATTGDGELSGVKLIETIVKSGTTLGNLAKVMSVYPQVLINVGVTPEGKQKYNNDEYIISAVQEAEMELHGDGRVLVRVSGTEPLVRVMLEGKDLEKITKLGNDIADVVKERLS